MKKVFILFIFLYANAYSQKDSVVNFLDRKLKIVQNKNHATYLSTAVKQDSLWDIKVYKPNGSIYLRYKSISSDGLIRYGKFQRFNEKGIRTYVTHYNSDGKINGKSISFFDKGDRISMVGNSINGKREGIWKFYFDNDSIRAKLYYSKGKITKHLLWDRIGNKKNEELIFERRPEYKGGIKKLRKKN